MWIIRTTKVDLRHRRCERILLMEDVGITDLGGSPAVEVLRHQVWPQRVELQLRVSSRCFARLAYAYYPQLRVTADGSEVAPWKTAGRFVALRLEQGTHEIVLEPHLSPLRKLLLLLDAVVLAGFAGGIWWRRREQRE